MFQMVRSLGIRSTVRHELPSGAAAFVIAELFYKFHSFALEALAFLATWAVLSWLEKQVTSLLAGRERPGGDKPA